MKTVTELVNIFVFYIVCVYSAHLKLGRFARRVEMDNEVYTEHFLQELHIDGKLDCLSRCNINDNCYIVTYNVNSHHCRMYGTVVGNKVGEPGWQFWIALWCPRPVSLPNADVTFTQTFNSTAVYSCHPGYVFQGLSQVALCTEDGRWTGLSGTCSAVSCATPVSVPNADVISSATTYNSTASYNCHAGYVFVGSSKNIVCGEDGQWTGFSGSCEIIKDCSDILAVDGAAPDGVYTIGPTVGTGNVQVYCDMTNQGGGWTVLQRRKDGSENFFRNWADYRDGFGSLTGEFWLGNNNIYRITNQRQYQLRIDLEDFSNNKRSAVYSEFSIREEDQEFRLRVRDYSGDAGDSFFAKHDGMDFTTKDVDNDNSDNNCATLRHGAWWYNKCHDSNLNGEYNNTDNSNGINWYHFKGYEYSLKSTTMRIRPI